MRHSTEAEAGAEGGRGRGAVKEILTCLNQHRKQPLTQIQPQVASTFSLLLFSSVCGTLCGLSSSSSSSFAICIIYVGFARLQRDNLVAES